eukprot:scaffold36816_cov61-Phaeocystis_antarctica.AAC.1
MAIATNIAVPVDGPGTGTKVDDLRQLARHAGLLRDVWVAPVGDKVALPSSNWQPRGRVPTGSEALIRWRASTLERRFGWRPRALLAVWRSLRESRRHSVLPAAHSPRVENGAAQAVATPMRTRVRKLWLDSFA